MTTTSSPLRFRVPVLVAGTAAMMLAGRGLDALVAPVPVLAFLTGTLVAVGAVWGYRRLTRWAERRPVEELGRPRRIALGAAIGGGALTLTLLLGGPSFAGGSFWAFLAGAGVMAGVAVTEELVFRGVVFRLLEERWGSMAALVVSALVFGSVHLVNPHATVWGALAIGVEGGAMLGAAYLATRSLWLPIGLHFGWNAAQAALFGVTVSGSDTGPGLLSTTLTGPDLLTGGPVGPEAGLPALLVCLVPTLLLLRLARRRGNLIPRRRD
jgi:uncharacterized protein